MPRGLEKVEPETLREKRAQGDIKKLSSRVQPTQLVRLWLEVRPDAGATEQATYRVEMTRAVSAESMAKLGSGVVIAVKCDRSDPRRVMPETLVRVVSGQ